MTRGQIGFGLFRLPFLLDLGRERNTMELSIGQKVAYPSQGVCLVEQIAKKMIGATSINFYSLRVLSDNSIILVPMDNAESVGIRPIISPIQCKSLIEKL